MTLPCIGRSFAQQSAHRAAVRDQIHRFTGTFQRQHPFNPWPQLALERKRLETGSQPDRFADLIKLQLRKQVWRS